MDASSSEKTNPVGFRRLTSESSYTELKIMAENPTTETSTSTQNVVVDEMEAGQAKLYSPDYAAATPAMSARRNLGAVKDRLLEKLSASSVPKDALENARNFLETVVRDVTLASHGLTRDALLRIKSHLVEFLPSLSPATAKRMVDDEAEKEVNEGIGGGERRHGEGLYPSKL